MQPIRYAFGRRDQWVLVGSGRRVRRLRAVEFEPDTGAVTVEWPDLDAGRDESDLAPPVYRLRLGRGEYRPCDPRAFAAATSSARPVGRAA